MSCPGFREAFAANMTALGLPVPGSLFSTQQQVVSTIAQITGTIKTFGAKVTIGELIGAGTISEALAVASAFYASWSVGGLIGSLMVAADARLTCGTTTSALHAVTFWSMRTGVSLPKSLLDHMAMHPELMQPGTSRRSYAALGKAA